MSLRRTPGLPISAAGGRRAARNRRYGAITIMSVVMMVALLGLVALSLDTGYLLVARTELQRSADAAALAGAAELLYQKDKESDPGVQGVKTRQTAARYAAVNKACGATLTLRYNSGNSPEGDIVLGEIEDPTDSSSPMTYGDPTRYNAVKVHIKHPAPLFFGRIFGLQTRIVQAEATAAFLASFKGFKPVDNKNLPILPFTLKKSYWDSVLRGETGSDNWAWHANSEQVTSGSDGVLEVNLYPWDTGSNGNSGTIDIGSNNSSTPKLIRQLTEGVSAEDLSFHGDKLSLDTNGELNLNMSADPGLKAGVLEPALQGCIGKEYIVPLYRAANASGQNATYTIVGFAGVRLVSVDLKGGNKRVLIQPAPLVTKGGISDGGNGSSQKVYSNVFLSL